MGEFDDYARRLAEGNAAKIAAHEVETKQRQLNWQEAFQDAKRNLEEVVLPMLDEASSACADQGLTPTVKRSWETNGASVAARIEFKLSGQKQRSMGQGHYEVSGHEIEFTFKDGDFHCRVARKSLNTEKDKNFSGDGVEAVKQAILIAMDSVFNELSPDRG